MLDLEEYVDADKLDYVLDQLKKHYLENGKLTEENGLERLTRVQLPIFSIYFCFSLIIFLFVIFITVNDRSSFSRCI